MPGRSIDTQRNHAPDLDKAHASWASGLALATLAVACLAAAACAGAPRERTFVAPIVTLTESQFRGSILAASGVRTPLAPEHEVLGVVRARWIAHAGPPPAYGPMEPGARLIDDHTGAAHFATAPRLAAGASWSDSTNLAAPTDDSQVLGIAEAMLVADATTVLAIELPPSPAVVHPGESRWDRAEIFLCGPATSAVAPADEFELSLRLVGQAVGTVSGAAADGVFDDTPTAPESVDELVVFPATVGRASGRVILPGRPRDAASTNTAGAPRNRLYVVCELEFSAVEAQPEDLAPALAASKSATTTPFVRAPAVTPATEFPILIEALRTRTNPRAALLRLAMRLDSTLTRDLALAADDAQLDGMCTTVLAAVDAVIPDSLATPAAAPERLAAVVARNVEGALYTDLAREVERDALPIEFESVLIRHAGQAARQPGSLREVVQNAATTEDLRNGLVAENLLFLEDNTPAARVRAHSWLAARGQALAGFDPLAPAAERRAAIQRALASTATEPQ
ncbi:MAG: hypothetical protein AB7O52_11010 [Planctomycetota bacterium]